MKKSYGGLILVIFSFFVARAEPLVANYTFAVIIDLVAIFLVAWLLHLMLRDDDSKNKEKKNDLSKVNEGH